MAFTHPVWEVRVSGSGSSDSNGGGFDPGGATFASDGAATSATGTTPLFSSASYNFVAGDVGAWVFIRSGTNWTPGWYKITAVSSNKATLDAAVGHCPGYASGASTSRVVATNTVAGCATTASPTSATWGVDYSQQDGPQIAFTDMVIDVTLPTRFSSAGNPVGKNMIGNMIKVVSGTGFTVQWVMVVSTSGTLATVDKSLGTLGSTGGHGNLGGALASPGTPSGTSGLIVTNSTTVFVVSGSYSITTTTAGAGGPFVSVLGMRLEGYGTYRGDMGTPPVLTVAGGVGTFTVLSLTNTTGYVLRNFTVDGASQTAVRGVNTTALLTQRITVLNCTNTGYLNSQSNAHVFDVVATGCATAGNAIDVGGTGLVVVNCVAANNTVPGFNTGNHSIMVSCLAAANTGATVDGFVGGSPMVFLNCVAYGNGRDGFRINAADVQWLNCIAEGNGVTVTGFGFNSTIGSLGLTRTLLEFSATYNNSGGAYNTVGLPMGTPRGMVVGTGTFFTNAAGGDFSLNTTAGGGAALRGAGWPGALAYGGTGYMDIGALQAPYAVTGHVAAAYGSFG